MPTKAKAELSDLHRPSPGPGLFTDPRAEASAFHTYLALLRFLKRWSHRHPELEWKTARVHVRSGLVEVARCYWADYDHERKVAGHNVKAKAQKLRLPLAKVVNIMSKLPFEARQALNLEFTRSHKQPEREIADVFSDALHANVDLLAALTLISTRQYARGGSSRVKKACVRLWTMWENVSGRPFVRQYETSHLPPGKGQKRPREQFVTLDAQFVHLALESIDHKVTLTKVRAALRLVPQEKLKTKEAEVSLQELS